MKRAVLVVTLIGGLVWAGGLIWWLSQRAHEAPELVLHGNVDLRQVDLAFNNSERIAAVLVQEGDRVRQGQVLARLDTSRLEPQLAQVEAQAAAQRHIVERLQHGSRPEEIAQAEAQAAAQRHIVARLPPGRRPQEIAQARANVEAAKADVTN